MKGVLVRQQRISRQTHEQYVLDFAAGSYRNMRATCFAAHGDGGVGQSVWTTVCFLRPSGICTTRGKIDRVPPFLEAKLTAMAVEL